MARPYNFSETIGKPCLSEHAKTDVSPIVPYTTPNQKEPRTKPCLSNHA